MFQPLKYSFHWSSKFRRLLSTIAWTWLISLRGEPPAPLQPDGVEPELCLAIVALDGDVRRFVPVTRVEEEAIRSVSENGRREPRVPPRWAGCHQASRYSLRPHSQALFVKPSPNACSQSLSRGIQTSDRGSNTDSASDEDLR